MTTAAVITQVDSLTWFVVPYDAESLGFIVYANYNPKLSMITIAECSNHISTSYVTMEREIYSNTLYTSSRGTLSRTVNEILEELQAMDDISKPHDLIYSYGGVVNNEYIKLPRMKSVN